MGSTANRIPRITRSSVIRESREPHQEPASAAATPGRASFHRTSPLRMNRTVVRDVPQAEESLFVPMARWTGSPANR